MSRVSPAPKELLRRNGAQIVEVCIRTAVWTPLRAGSNIGPHFPRFLPWNRGRAATHTKCHEQT